MEVVADYDLRASYHCDKYENPAENFE
jgi:hypothetical protein